MNIFYLDKNTVKCAKYHNNKHVVKMILETAQLLSTAHRVIDGWKHTFIQHTALKQHGIQHGEPLTLMALSRVSKKIEYKLPTGLDELLYKATHINHPSSVWVRYSKQNYMWLHQLLVDLCWEYTHRYGKVHLCERKGLVAKLATAPSGIHDLGFTEPTPAMPDEYKVAGDSIQSYRRYYIEAKQELAQWKNRDVPSWYKLKEVLL